MALFVEEVVEGAIEGGLLLVRQLVEETEVAVVEIDRVLELLYRVKAEVDVPALEVVLIELRQLPETIELALDATGRPLRVLLGDTARSERLSAAYIQESKGGLVEVEAGCPLLAPAPPDGTGGAGGARVALARRPLLQVDEPSSDLDAWEE